MLPFGTVQVHSSYWNGNQVPKPSPTRWREGSCLFVCSTIKRRKWAEILWREKMGNISWLHLMLLVIERHERWCLCSLAACGIFSQWSTTAGVWKTGSKNTSRDEAYWQETIFLRAYEERESFGYRDRAKQSCLGTSLKKKNNTMSKSPCILFRCFCFLFVMSFGKHDVVVFIS